MAEQKTRTIDGVRFPDFWPDITCLLWLFRNAPTLSKNPFAWSCFGQPADQPWTGTGRFKYAKIIDQAYFQKSFEYHDWSEAATDSFCSYEQTAITGCGGSSKSTSAGAYAWKFYQCDPLRTAVLIASTTYAAAKKRIWKNVSGFYSDFCRQTGYRQSTMVGNPAPSICPLREDAHGVMKRDTAYGIHVIAVAQGELQKGIDSMKGFHPERLLFIADEVDACSPALIDVQDNLRIGCEEYQAIWLGNDPSLFNPLGKLMEPGKGQTITLGHKDWTSTQGIHCLRFDGYDSPNIRDNNKWKGIIRQQDIDAITRNGVQANTPMAWIMVRGLHPPEGSDDTVVSEAMLLRFHTSERVTWQRGYTLSASLDPGFGGDPCSYRTFKRGLDVSGITRVEIDEVIEIPIVANDPGNPAEYQIAHKVMELSKARSIPPEEFIAGTTGIGRGVGAVLQREWSPRVNLCEEGGACSDLIVSEETPRPAKELYDRRVTELWFSIREFVEADMIRNLDPATAIQLQGRKHETKGTGAGKRISLEKKTDMKDRGLSSPNEADALAFYIDLLRSKGVNASVSSPVKEAAHDQMQSVMEEYEAMEIGDYSEEFADAD